MTLHKFLFLITASVFILTGCNEAKSDPKSSDSEDKDTLPVVEENKEIIVGAERTDVYFPLLVNKRVAIMANPSSLIGNVHLVDSLIAAEIDLVKIFSPEHGFRGDADAGETVASYVDERTGVHVISLYGNSKKAKRSDLEGLDVVVFDLQDVGTRFFTYISSLHYLMEACGENNIPMIILDRPNPNGHFVDGPILEEQYQSFIGMHPIPVTHGMTIGEYAQMINGEGWLKDGVQCDITVITCDNYNHSMRYELPVRPSPNLPNYRSIELYPHICFFEGTTLSVGRGTDMQFQIIGHPLLKGLGDEGFSFTPEPNEGSAYPKMDGKECFGFDLRIPEEQFDSTFSLNLNYLLYAYEIFPDKSKFFQNTNLFEKLAGTAELRKQIKAGMTEDEIKETWTEGLEEFKAIRLQYLLYKDR